MAKYPFGTDPSELKFDITQDNGKTRILMGGTQYRAGTVTFDSNAAGSIELKIGNGSSSEWKLKEVTVTLNPGSTSPTSIPMKKDDDGTWKGTLEASAVTGLVDGSLHVTARWKDKESGQKDPDEDPVIIINPKSTP